MFLLFHRFSLKINYISFTWVHLLINRKIIKFSTTNFKSELLLLRLISNLHPNSENFLFYFCHVLINLFLAFVSTSVLIFFCWQSRLVSFFDIEALLRNVVVEWITRCWYCLGKKWEWLSCDLTDICELLVWLFTTKILFYIVYQFLLKVLSL